MPVLLPIPDPFIDGSAPLYEPGQPSITQSTLEQVMARDFPTVACLGIERYAERLLHVVYTHGAQAFYLDWNPPLPSYLVVFMEPWSTSIGDAGGLVTHLKYLAGPDGAARAEEVRRWIGATNLKR